MDISEKHIIAMWSGPRNLSTAMMRAFENRPDCTVWDEPFYAAYLQQTGLNHPMRAEILASHDGDAQKVAERCEMVADTPIIYQKHMTHHMLAKMPLGWMNAVSHAFLIRHPARVVASYGAKHDELRLSDIGFTQQLDLFNKVSDHLGTAPPVIDATAIRAQPRVQLMALCAALHIPFLEAMLSWPAGRRTSDGIWAAHWYDAVEQSTGFAPADNDLPILTSTQQLIVEDALPIYEALKRHSFNPAGPS